MVTTQVVVKTAKTAIDMKSEIRNKVWLKIRDMSIHVSYLALLYNEWQDTARKSLCM